MLFSGHQIENKFRNGNMTALILMEAFLCDNPVTTNESLVTEDSITFWHGHQTENKFRNVNSPVTTLIAGQYH